MVKLSSKALIALATLIGAFITISAQCFEENDDATKSVMKSGKANLYKGQQEFTVSLLNAINKATPKENIFFSPYSTYHALLLAYFGSKHETKAELLKALHLDWARDKYDVQQAYRTEKQLRSMRALDKRVVFSSANRIYVSHDKHLKSCLEGLFEEELQSVNFGADPEKARKDINTWIANVTENELPEVLSPGDITQGTNLVLANAAYFKGQWESKFDAADTNKEIFYTSSEKQVFVDMMSKRGTYNLGINERLGAHILEMPYLAGNGSQISMIVMLPPANGNSVEKLLRELTSETLTQALNDGSPREIDVKFPKFSFEQKIELVPILSQMGINNLFSSQADISGFTEEGNLSLDDAKHVAKIQVDENGSTASAATVLFSFRSARPLEPTTFVCNHPFVFLIFDHRSQAVLFAGIYREPEQHK